MTVVCVRVFGWENANSNELACVDNDLFLPFREVAVRKPPALGLGWALRHQKE